MAGPSPNESTWVAHNDEVLASLRVYPTARAYLSESSGIADRIVHSPADTGPPYSGYVTERRYTLAKPAAAADIGKFYARQLPGWIADSVPLSCEWTLTSPAGAWLTIDACHGTDPVTREYEVDVNYDQAWSTAQAQLHG